jgi:glycosyltransferase involved in cell wall biosynthesis
MKTLLVTHRYPPRTGGVETHVRELATRLADRGDDVTVFSADAGPAVPADTVADGVRVRRFRAASPGESFYVAPGLVPAVRRADADVVHAHNYHALPLLLAALGVTDERFVVTPHYHGASADGVRNALLSGYRPLGRWALRRADAVIAVSEWERDRLRADFGVDATVIPNGVDVERFAAADAEKRTRPYLLSVGRLEEYKGVQHAIRALSALSAYELVVAGSGPYRDELERIAREEGVADRVDFLGYVADERLPGLYAGSEAFLNLSAFEAYGITVAEALAAGTPCVVREVGALGEWSNVAGCVGTDTVAPEVVARCVRDAAAVEASTAPVWRPDDVVDAVRDRYTHEHSPSGTGR